jgi:hypothetical protein
MKSIARVTTVLVLLFSLITLLASAPFVSGDHGSTHHNAINHKFVDNYGVSVVIESTDPDINNGTSTYVRAVVVDDDTANFGEIGWIKWWTGTFEGLYVFYEWGTTIRNLYFEIDEPTEDHLFEVRYNTLDYWDFRMDSNWIASKDIGFSQSEADRVACGGEAKTGVEGMGSTRCGNGSSNGLQYISKVAGEWVWYNWNGYSVYVEDSPYETVYINDHNFRVSGNED